MKSRFPSVHALTDYREMLADPGIDAVAIATPISTHYNLALQALQAGKHVLVEKPLAARSEDAIRLIEEADSRNRVLMVDHTFVYTGAVRKIKELISGDTLGDIYYYDSVRVNLGLFQHDLNVIWDLAVHDLSIMDYVLPYRPCAVSATGMSHFPGEPENIAYLTLFFDEPLIAHLHVNWLAPVKIRRTLIGSSQKMIVYDDLEPSEKIKVYDKGISRNNGSESVYQMLISYRTGDMWAPHLDTTEALRAELRHFVRCIEHGQPPANRRRGRASASSRSWKRPPNRWLIGAGSSSWKEVECRHDPVPRLEGAVSGDQARDRRGDRPSPGERPVRPG